MMYNLMSNYVQLMVFAAKKLIRPALGYKAYCFIQYVANTMNLYKNMTINHSN
jgi:hypothetical protein